MCVVCVCVYLRLRLIDAQSVDRRLEAWVQLRRPRKPLLLRTLPPASTSTILTAWLLAAAAAAAAACCAAVTVTVTPLASQARCRDLAVSNSSGSCCPAVGKSRKIR